MNTAMSAAQGFLVSRLELASRAVAGYLDRQGLSRADAAEFGLGFDPGERGGLVRHLVHQGYTHDDLLGDRAHHCARCGATGWPSHHSTPGARRRGGGHRRQADSTRGIDPCKLRATRGDAALVALAAGGRDSDE